MTRRGWLKIHVLDWSDRWPGAWCSAPETDLLPAACSHHCAWSLYLWCLHQSWPIYKVVHSKRVQLKKLFIVEISVQHHLKDFVHYTIFLKIFWNIQRNGAFWVQIYSVFKKIVAHKSFTFYETPYIYIITFLDCTLKTKQHHVEHVPCMIYEQTSYRFWFDVLSLGHRRGIHQ